MQKQITMPTIPNTPRSIIDLPYSQDDDRMIGIESGIRSETLAAHGYAEMPALVKMVARGKITKRVPLLNAKIDVRAKRLVFQVPSRIDQKPKPHGVVFDTFITSLAD